MAPSPLLCLNLLKCVTFLYLLWVLGDALAQWICLYLPSFVALGLNLRHTLYALLMIYVIKTTICLLHFLYE